MTNPIPYEDSDDTRAEFEAFASMMGIPSQVAKQILKEENKVKKVVVKEIQK